MAGKAELDSAIADLNAVVAKAVAQLLSGVVIDLAPQVAAVKAATDALVAALSPVVVPPPPPPPSGLAAVPASVALTTAVPTQVVDLTGAVGAVTAVSSDPAIVTVSTSEPWIVTMIAAGSASVTFTDSSPVPQVLTVGVVATA